MIKLEERLKEFQCINNILSKGPLSLVMQFTRMVRDKEFPLDYNDFQTSSKGQVAGLSGSNLKKILKEHGITQQLSSEGGRTSRGSMGLMIKYVNFLNAWRREEEIDFDAVEAYWAEQVRAYFRNKPFILSADKSKTIGASFDDLFEQAKKRQKQNNGTQYLGIMLQHLVAAKLCSILPKGSFEFYQLLPQNTTTSKREARRWWMNAGALNVDRNVYFCASICSKEGLLIVSKTLAQREG